MTYLANDLRTQADYIRGCLKFGHLGYADGKMLEKIEQAAARITTQHDDLGELRDLAKEQASQNSALTAANAHLEAVNTELRVTLEDVVEELSSALARYQRDGSQDICNSYKLFEILETARKALK